MKETIMEIRNEQPGDEQAITQVNCQAFASMDEAYIVEVMRRHWPTYQRELSIVAWDGPQAIGHILMTPARIRLLDQTIDALAVGPVAVVPARQRQGIGGQLLCHCHEIGARAGYALSFLYGHRTYYPRHGYRPCFSGGKITLDSARMPAATLALRAMPVCETDLPWLVACHAREWHDVDFGWLWGPTLAQWTLPGLNAVVWWTDDGRRAAYTLKARGRLCMLLADDPDLARQVLWRLKPATIDLHPCGWFARHVLQEGWSSTEVGREPSPSAMACELRPGVVDACLAAQRTGRPSGGCMFPTPFLLC